MNQQGCSISEAVRKSGVEAYVLRYWEEEGLLDVKRNRKGHRCYTQAEFDAIKWIQSLKEEGYTLKDIREMKEKKGIIEENSCETVQKKNPETENLQDSKEVPVQEEKKNRQDSEQTIRNAPEAQWETEKEEERRQFFAILERVVKEVAVTRNREARYRRLDEAIRRQQKTRQMIAATEEERQEKGKLKKKKRR